MNAVQSCLLLNLNPSPSLLYRGKKNQCSYRKKEDTENCIYHPAFTALILPAPTVHPKHLCLETGQGGTVRKIVFL